MAAIDESLWCWVENNANRYLKRYNIATGEWSDVVKLPAFYGNADSMGVWDGGFYIWIYSQADTSDADYVKKRLNIHTFELSDYPQDPDILDQFEYGMMAQDFGGKIYVAYYQDLGVFSYTTKVWGYGVSPPNNPRYCPGITVAPPWANNQPGNIFLVRGRTITDFYMFNPVTGIWTVKDDVLGTDAVYNARGMAWAQVPESGTPEYIYFTRDDTHFDKYNVAANSWSNIGSMPTDLGHNCGSNTLVWDGDRYLFWITDDDNGIYRFDLIDEAWEAYVTFPGDGLDAQHSIVYTPRIRFIFCDSNGTELYEPASLGSIPKDRTSIPVKYYLKALEAETEDVTIGFVSDHRTDAEDILEIAPDVAGAPGAWGSSVNLGSFTENEYKAFWLRADPVGAAQEAKIARFKLTIG